MINNKKLNSIVSKLFIRGRKLNISLVSITQSYFKVPKDIKRNSAHYFIMKVLNKREYQTWSLKISLRSAKNVMLNHILFLVVDATLSLDNPLTFRKNLLKWIYNKIMTINDQIRDEKLQYYINRKAAEISALSSGKIDKYE